MLCTEFKGGEFDLSKPSRQAGIVSDFQSTPANGSTSDQQDSHEKWMGSEQRGSQRRYRCVNQNRSSQKVYENHNQRGGRTPVRDESCHQRMGQRMVGVRTKYSGQWGQLGVASMLTLQNYITATCCICSSGQHAPISVRITKQRVPTSTSRWVCPCVWVFFLGFWVVQFWVNYYQLRIMLQLQWMGNYMQGFRVRWPG